MSKLKIQHFWLFVFQFTTLSFGILSKIFLFFSDTFPMNRWKFDEHDRHMINDYPVNQKISEEQINIRWEDEHPI